MNRPDSIKQRAEELVSWTSRERFRFLWYRLRLTIAEMNYASRRMAELQMGLPSRRPTAAPAEPNKVLSLYLLLDSRWRILPPDLAFHSPEGGPAANAAGPPSAMCADG
jgi:hypothetical protein